MAIDLLPPWEDEVGADADPLVGDAVASIGAGPDTEPRRRRPVHWRLVVAVAVIAGTLAAGGGALYRWNARDAVAAIDRAWEQARSLDNERRDVAGAAREEEIDGNRTAAGLLDQEADHLDAIAHSLAGRLTVSPAVRRVRDRTRQGLLAAAASLRSESAKARRHGLFNPTSPSIADSDIDRDLAGQRRRWGVAPTPPSQGGRRYDLDAARSQSRMAPFLPDRGGGGADRDHFLAVGTADGIRVVDLATGTVSAPATEPGHLAARGRIEQIEHVGEDHLVVLSESVGSRRDFDFSTPGLALPVDADLGEDGGPGARSAWATVDGITRVIGADGALTGPVVRLPAGERLAGATPRGLVTVLDGNRQVALEPFLPNSPTGLDAAGRSVVANGALLAVGRDTLVATTSGFVGAGAPFVPVHITDLAHPSTGDVLLAAPSPGALPVRASFSPSGGRIAVTWVKASCAGNPQPESCARGGVTLVVSASGTGEVLFSAGLTSPGSARLAPQWTPSERWIIIAVDTGPGARLRAIPTGPSVGEPVNIDLPGIEVTAIDAG